MFYKLYFVVLLLFVIERSSGQIIDMQSEEIISIRFETADSSTAHVTLSPGKEYIIFPSDSLQQSAGERFWYSLTLKNNTARTRWRLTTPYNVHDMRLYVQDLYGDNSSWPIELKTGIIESRSSFFYFPLDFSAKPEMTIQFALDSTASGRFFFTLEPNSNIIYNPLRFGVFLAVFLVIMISLLLFAIFSKDFIYPVAVINFLCIGFLFVTLAMEYPLYVINPLAATAFSMITEPAFFLLIPILLYQSFRRSISLYLWIAHAFLIVGFPYLLRAQGDVFSWWMQYASLQLFITPALAMLSITEQLIRKRKPRSYFYVCMIMAACMIFVYVWPINSEFWYLYNFMPEMILFGALVYRFTITMKNIKHEKLQAAVAQGKAINYSLLRTQESERERIAKGLHDEVGSSLAALKLYAESIDVADTPHIRNIIHQLDQCAQSVRNISHNLLPPAFTSTPLETLLEDHLCLIRRKTTLQFDFIASGAPVSLPVEMKLVFYRVALELATNIIKHANATTATMQLIYFDDHLQLLCEDNGHGFDKTSREGLGLRNIKARIAYLGGTLTIETDQYGTTTVIECPIGYGAS